MFEITRYQARRRVKGTAAMVVGFGAFALLMIGIFPSIESSGVDFEAYIESLPDAFQTSFGIEAFDTMEGFLAVEFYQFIWVLLLGLYVAYAAGDAIASDVERGRLDLVLATPLSRSRVLLERFLSLIATILVLNLVVPLVIFGGVLAVGEEVSFGSLVAVHALSIPYLLVCGSLGLVLSVSVSRGTYATRGAIAVVFLLFVVHSVTGGTNFEWLGWLSPTLYYDPTEILVEESIDVGGAALLSVAAAVLLEASRQIFTVRDLG